MDLIFTNKNHEDMGVLQDFDLDLAFGADENDFECSVPAASHCCEAGSLLYMEGTEYGGIVDTIESDTEAKEVKYKGRTWHGILGSKVIEPLKEGEGSGSRLPKGYTELPYIESTGTQFVDTGFKPNQDTKVVVDVQSVGVNTEDTGQSFFGARNGTEKRFYATWHRTNAAYYAYYYNTSRNVASDRLTDRMTVTMDRNILTVGNSVSVNVPVTGTFECETSMYLFATNLDGTADYFGVNRVYSCQIYDNDVLARDFVPCINPGGEVGLYDLVTAAFFGNSGTGSFIAGAVPRKLPEGYTQVEYIESNGTQYIDTGFKMNQDSRVKMRVQPTAKPSSYGWLFDGRDAGGKASKGVIYFNGYWCADYNVALSATRYSFTTVSPLDILNIDYDKNSCTINGETGTFEAETFQSTTNLVLLALNTAGTVNFFVNAKLYSCQVYDNGTMIRDFVPCKNSSGVLGMYDLANNAFYQNAGSGTFAAGADVEYVEPSTGGTVNGVTIKAEDADGNSMVGKYLVISGDANDCINFILSRIGLSSLLCAFEEAAGVDIQEYQFHRFTDAYSGLTGMLASAGQKLHTEVHGGQVVLSAEAVVDYTADEEFDSDLVDFVAIKKFNAVNHLICLGAGELENRTVIHLYADKEGNISQEQTLDGLDEVVAVYEDTNAEAEELIRKGTEELLKLWEPDKLKVDFDDSTDSYDVGDIVGAYDNITGISVAAVITKKIVTIKNGLITISYKVGE